MFVDGFNSTDDDVTGIELVDVVDGDVAVLSDLMDVVEPPVTASACGSRTTACVQQPFDLAHCITSNALKNEL